MVNDRVEIVNEAGRGTWEQQEIIAKIYALAEFRATKIVLGWFDAVPVILVGDDVGWGHSDCVR